MWQLLTDCARRAIFRAQEVAQRVGDTQVRERHLLIGLLRAADSAAFAVMNSLGIDNIELANQLESELVVSGTEVPHELKLAPDASRCIGLAYNESREQGKEKIGSHHLLLVVLKGIKLKKRFAQLAMPPEMSTTNTSLKFRRKDQRATAIYVRTTTSFRKFVKTQAQPTG